MKRWISGEQAREKLESMNRGDAFALRYDESYGCIKQYAVIEKFPYYNDNKDNDNENNKFRFLKCKTSPTPIRDDFIKANIYYDETDEQILYSHTRGQENKCEINTSPLDVDYSSDKQMYAVCNGCGQKYLIPVSENQLPVARNRSLIKDDGETITPCCREDWSSTLD